MYNCKKNGKTAKLYVGIIQEISTTAKKIAQLQNQLYICKKKCTTAKHIYCSCTFFGINYSTTFAYPYGVKSHRA